MESLLNAVHNPNCPLLKLNVSGERRERDDCLSDYNATLRSSMPADNIVVDDDADDIPAALVRLVCALFHEDCSLLRVDVGITFRDISQSRMLHVRFAMSVG